MAAFESDSTTGLQLLVLTNGLIAEELVTVIEGLVHSSKSVGTHKRRELYWNGYHAMISSLSTTTGKVYAFLKYSIDSEGEGKVEVVELTKRQRGLVTGGCDIIGKKHRFEGDAATGGTGAWAISFDENSAQAAFDDLNNAEPCIYLSTEGIYVTTQFKRVQCKAFTASPFKSLKDIESAIAAMPPTLRSISFAGSDVPSVLPYNVLLSGVAPAVAALIPITHNLGLCASTQPADLYEAFVARRNSHLIGEAGKMIGQMLVDVNKNLVPLIGASVKDAGVARRNSLMKKVYVHQSKTKFIEGVKADGDGIELNIITGDINESLPFFQYGGIVFELFYRTDLSIFG